MVYHIPVRFLPLYRKRRQQPEAVSDEQWSQRRESLIVSACLAVLTDGSLISPIIWLSSATFSM